MGAGGKGISPVSFRYVNSKGRKVIDSSKMEIHYGVDRA